ncbi:MAG: hypothetical protein LAO06_07940 [Acidobacteriia bacterium]|nr:hypothetical protein [Terriglobia bacterium]
MLQAMLWLFLALAAFALLNGAWFRLFVRLEMRRKSGGHGKVISIDTHRLRKRPVAASFAR